MRIVEILSEIGKLDLPISNEESSFIDKIKEQDNSFPWKKLSDREKKLTELLIRRDIVYIKDEAVHFNKLIGPEF